MDQPAGISAQVLAERSRVLRTARPLTDRELRKWLVSSGLAQVDRGRLTATPLGRELVRAFNPLQGA